jgi:hypothetical protein
VIMSISDGNGAFASAALGKGFPFITATVLQQLVEPVGYLV